LSIFKADTFGGAVLKSLFRMTQDKKRVGGVKPKGCHLILLQSGVPGLCGFVKNAVGSPVWFRD
jgi:hypothetical protein